MLPRQDSNQRFVCSQFIRNSTLAAGRHRLLLHPVGHSANDGGASIQQTVPQFQNTFRSPISAAIVFAGIRRIS